MPTYAGLSYEVGNVWSERSDIGFDTAREAGSLFVGVETLFGPIYLAAGFAEGGKSNLFLFLGAPPP